MAEDNETPSEDQEGVERVPPNRETPYSEIRLSEEAGEILLLSRRDYKFSISFSFMNHKMHPIRCLFHTGEEPNIIR